MRAAPSFSLLLLPVLVAPASAASAGYCSQYAHAAVRQYYMATTMGYPHCAAGAVGLRWQPDFNAHYAWCRSADGAAVQSEWNARTRYLYFCSRS